VPNPQLQVVAARQAGVIASLLVAEGEQVTAGQLLARLQSPDLVAIQSDYLEALTRLTLAESEVARDRMLQREGVIAERRLLESRARRDELQTLAAQRRQVLALAGMSEADIDRLAETRTLTSSLPVRAPIGGVVLEQMVGTGESVPAAAPLYQIADLSALWVEVHVPVEQLEGIGTGSRALLSESGIEARIVTVGRLVHGEDQGVLVRAKVTDGAERLRPGQFVEVQLATATWCARVARPMCSWCARVARPMCSLRGMRASRRCRWRWSRRRRARPSCPVRSRRPSASSSPASSS